MNKPNVRKWVKALRSGKYKQVTGKLRKPEGYCCLGIVCTLAGIRAKKNFACTSYSFDGEGGGLPPRARKWLGVPNSDPRIGRLSAIHLNDANRLSFDKIADRIEKHWLSA